MGLQALVLAKLSLSATSHSLTPLSAALLWPFVIKFSFSFRPLRELYIDILHSLRLFFFQLRQITMNDEPGGAASANRNSRWERAVRLICERVTQTRHAQSGNDSGEDSLRAISMLAL
ncbi:unnamed protein product [Fraxinus pennsylvanica]|uniref:Uncharacterized protein n=1 Tax=Fraxinus pennsylvanica TaxID=56036 RepID=A0AAD2E5I4_9LAMI|nr:unnamed protein product [Fraxinus pennsylvanica]